MEKTNKKKTKGDDMISLSHVPFKCKCKKYAKKKEVTAEQPKEIQKDLTRGQSEIDI